MVDNDSSVLVVDDEQVILRWCAAVLNGQGFSVTCASDEKTALDSFRETDFEVALVDLYLHGSSGLDFIQKAKQNKPDIEIVIMTGDPSLETSLAAIENHVFGYLIKPVSAGALIKAVQSASKQYRLVRENETLIQQLQDERSRLKERVIQDQNAMLRLLQSNPELVGVSDSVEQIRRQIAEVAPSDMTVLLRGESGTGKDVVARLINELSGRSSPKPLVKINCPAIPETLLESELFGHERGAFTGADKRKPGRIELAAGGNIFLDEIAEIPVTLQAKLLQVIEHKVFCRLGETTPRKVDARILAATNAPLDKMMADGTFRADLYYRLNDYTIFLPPLRERPEDVPVLVDHFVKKHAAAFGKESQGLSSRTLDAMQAYSWPGNVRELESVIRRFVLTSCEDSVLSVLHGAQSASHVSSPHAAGTSTTPSAFFGSVPGNPPADAPAEQGVPELSDQIRAAEADTIVRALRKTNWNRRKAAGILGISYSTMRRKMAACDIKEPQA